MADVLAKGRYYVVTHNMALNGKPYHDFEIGEVVQYVGFGVDGNPFSTNFTNGKRTELIDMSDVRDATGDEIANFKKKQILKEAIWMQPLQKTR